MPSDAITRFGALFERDGSRFVPTELARGPWDPNALHGGAPSALFATMCEKHDPGSASFMARLTVELLRPVPLAPLELKVRTFRPGKKVQWLEASLFDAEGREVARAAALRLRVDDVNTTGAMQPDHPSPPGPESVTDPGFPIGAALVGFWSANDVRIVGGSWTEPGPATAWFRLRCPVIAGEPLSSFVRVAAAADFGSGVGNPVRFTHAAAINAEVTVHVHRHPVGEWVCLDSAGWAQSHGVGMADSLLHDEHGPIGRAVQTLLVESLDERPMRSAPGVQTDSAAPRPKG